MQLYACASVVFFASVDVSTPAQLQRWWYFSCYTKRKEQDPQQRFWQVSHSPILYIYHTWPFFQIAKVYQPLFMPQYRFHIYLVVNPKSELEFKMVVTVGLQDISSMYIHNTGNLICLYFICLLFKNKAYWILPAQHSVCIFHVYLVVNPKRELESKMAVTVGLQVISSMHITLENPYVYILYVYRLRIKLTGFCHRRPQ